MIINFVEIRLEAEGCISSNLLPVACDITQMSDVQFVVSRAVETYGTIDVLVNNAGCMYYEMMKNGPTKVCSTPIISYHINFSFEREKGDEEVSKSLGMESSNRCELSWYNELYWSSNTVYD